MNRNILKNFVLLCTIFFPCKHGVSQEQLLRCERVKTEAYFKNGTDNWASYLAKTINTQAPYLHCAPAGKFYVEARFLVEKDGSLVGVKPLTMVGFGMEEELMRLIKQSPNWVPATQNGRKCRAYKCADYVFVVNKNESDFL